MSIVPALIVAGCGLSLTGCHNPADDVPAAQTQAARNVDSAPPAAAKKYVVSPDSKIGWIGSKVTGSHEGGFNAFRGEFAVADGQLTSQASIEIETASLYSDNDRLTGHLKSADFFDVATFPKATFTPTSIEKGATQHTVTGNLELHGVTKSITFPADVSITEEQVSVKADFSIKRFDFGIVYKGKADDLIRDEVVIKLDVVAKAG